MRVSLTLLSVLYFNSMFGQSFAEANAHFDRFEYAQTISVLEIVEKKLPFDLDQLKQLGYSYYAVGDFEKALPYIDTILGIKPIEPYFYFIKGETALALGQTDKAIEAYTKYQSLDGSVDVSLRIESARQLEARPIIEIDRFEEVSINHNKATILGNNYGSGNFVFREIGVNKSGEFLKLDDDINTAELLLMRPYVYNGSTLAEISVEGLVKYISIHAIAFQPNSDNVWVTVSEPLAQTNEGQLMKLYEGIFLSASNELKLGKKVEFPGLEHPFKTVGYPTINASGNRMVFCASTEKTTSGIDLFWCSKDHDEKWGVPTALTEVNTIYDDVYPRFFGDSILTFSSNGRAGYGGLDLFQVTLKDDELLSESLSLFPAPINSFKDDFYMNFQGDTIIQVSSNRLAETSDDNILSFHLPKKEEPILEPISEPIDTDAIFLAQWEIKYLYFDFDKFDILRDSKEVDFQGLNTFLKNNPMYKIELVGQTDNRGTEDYNLKLGLKRAESVKEELVNFGFNPDQILVISRGENSPIVDCSSNCSEEEHAMNRVVLVQLLTD